MMEQSQIMYDIPNINNFSQSPNVDVFEEPSTKIPSKPSGNKKEKSCEVCGRVLSSYVSYYVHMKSHSNNKPYKCTSCDASFSRKPYLSAHMRTHTGERPYKCKICEKKFSQKSSLNIHSRVHTGIRPYECDICHKCFAHKSYIISHRLRHLKQPITCQHCGLEFKTKRMFIVHFQSHQGVKQFHCELCGLSFKRESYFKKHNNKIHRGHMAEDSIMMAKDVL